MQRRATLWILGVFKTSPMFGIKAITELIPIKLHLQKLGGRLQLQTYSLPPNHLIRSLIELSPSISTSQHSSLLGFFTSFQCTLIKGYLVDMDNRFNEVFSSFVPLHSEFSPDNRVIDNFSDCFSFNLFNKQKDNNLKAHIQ